MRTAEGGREGSPAGSRGLKETGSPHTKVSPQNRQVKSLPELSVTFTGRLGVLHSQSEDNVSSDSSGTSQSQRRVIRHAPWYHSQELETDFYVVHARVNVIVHSSFDINKDQVKCCIQYITIYCDHLNSAARHGCLYQAYIGLCDREL